MADGKIAIFTCMTGGYDKPTDDFRNREGFDYFLFSDVPVQTRSWKNLIVKFNNADNLSNAKKQRFVKTHPHHVLKDYDIVVYIDCNTSVNELLYKYIEENKDNIITFKKHPSRDCIYDEIKAVLIARKETPLMGKVVTERLKTEGYPRHNGLFENNIIISHPKDERVQKLFELWWDEIYRYSHRDQLSLNYVIWKNKLEDIITAKKSLSFRPKVHQHIIPKNIEKSGKK